MKIPERIKAVIFDLDGLLIDSEPSWAEADKKLLGKRGYTPTDGLFVRRMGTGNKQTIEIYKNEFGINEQTQDLSDERLDLFYKYLESNLVLMDGAYDLIKKLFNDGKQLAIATSGSHKDKIDNIIKILGVESFFSVIITGQDIVNNKPAPDIFILAAKKLNVLPNECLVLEDAPNGVVAGKAARMVAYGVNKDSEIAQELKNAGADEVFSSLSEITV